MHKKFNNSNHSGALNSNRSNKLFINNDKTCNIRNIGKKCNNRNNRAFIIIINILIVIIIINNRNNRAIPPKIISNN